MVGFQKLWRWWRILSCGEVLGRGIIDFVVLCKLFYCRSLVVLVFGVARHMLYIGLVTEYVVVVLQDHSGRDEICGEESLYFVSMLALYLRMEVKLSSGKVLGC